MLSLLFENIYNRQKKKNHSPMMVMIMTLQNGTFEPWESLNHPSMGNGMIGECEKLAQHIGCI